MAKVFAIKGTENKVNFFFLIRNVAEWSEVGTKVLYWNHTTCGVKSENLFVRSCCNQREVRLRAKHVIDLSVTEEQHYTLLHNVLEYQVLVIVTTLDNV